MCLNSGFFNSKDGAIDRGPLIVEKFPEKGFNSKDGAIDSGVLLRQWQRMRSFNSKDGAIDRFYHFPYSAIAILVSIPKMVRLIVCFADRELKTGS